MGEKMDRKPDFINPEGTKWWKTDHGRKTLPNVSVWIGENKTGESSYFVFEKVKEKSRILHMDKLLEGVFVFLDLLEYDESTGAKVRAKD